MKPLPPPTRPKPDEGGSAGFTLLELLVVIGLIAALSFFLAGGLAGGGQTAALQSSQATLANMVSAARLKAPATGRKTRLLINTDPRISERYLRYVVLQLARQPGASPADWDTVNTVSLPAGVFVLPSALSSAGGLVANAAAWQRTSDPSADLVSDLFHNQTLTTALEGDGAAQTWTGVAFTPNGTLATIGGGLPPKGSLVLALGGRRPPGSYPEGESPVQLTNPEAVRGLILSAYGVPALVNDRRSF